MAGAMETHFLLVRLYAALIQEAVERLHGPAGITDVILMALAGGCALAFEGSCEAHQFIIVLWDLGVMAFKVA